MNPLVEQLAKESLSVAALASHYKSWRSNERLVDQALAVVDQLEPKAVTRALWIVHKSGNDFGLNGGQLKRLSEIADSADHWVARLLLCQIFATHVCPAGSREDVFPFLEKCFADRRVIIRAWAISALYPFRTDPIYKHEICMMLKIARKDQRKSMQARLRRLGLPNQTLEQTSPVVTIRAAGQVVPARVVAHF